MFVVVFERFIEAMPACSSVKSAPSPLRILRSEKLESLELIIPSEFVSYDVRFEGVKSSEPLSIKLFSFESIARMPSFEDAQAEISAKPSLLWSKYVPFATVVVFRPSPFRSNTIGSLLISGVFSALWNRSLQPEPSPPPGSGFGLSGK